MSDGYLVECVLDTDQRLHSDPFGEFDLEMAEDLAADLLRRTMVSRVYVMRIGTGEVVFEETALHLRLPPTLSRVSAPRDRILLPPPWGHR